MYEYKVVPLGDVRELRRGNPNRPVKEVDGDESDLLQQTLDAYAAEGWKLVTITQPGFRARMGYSLCVFERELKK